MNEHSHPNAGGSVLGILDSFLKDARQKKITENQIVVILEALANSDDAEVVGRFPAVLAICARRGLTLNSQALFARYWETSPKRQNLEKLLLVSAEIFRYQGIAAPGNLHKIAESLKPKYGALLERGEFQLSSGMSVSVSTLKNALTGYMAGRLQTRSPRNQRAWEQKKSAPLDTYLDRLFSPKQKELVFKKRDSQPFTKTEREYYSRVVRKKLEAIASKAVGDLAQTLLYKGSSPDTVRRKRCPRADG
jgi:hypothetical protein